MESKIVDCLLNTEFIHLYDAIYESSHSRGSWQVLACGILRISPVATYGLCLRRLLCCHFGDSCCYGS